jgi:hypothetical protein
VTRADKPLFIGAFMAGAAVCALLALGLALGYAGDTVPALVGSLAGAALRRRRG